MQQTLQNGRGYTVLSQKMATICTLNTVRLNFTNREMGIYVKVMLWNKCQTGMV